MVRSRPGIVLVMAIFHCLFGGLGLTCGLCTGIGQVTGSRGPRPASNPNMPPSLQRDDYQRVDEQVKRTVPFYRANVVFGQIAGVVFSLVLIGAAVGLFMMQPWGRWLSVAYAGAALGYDLFQEVYGVFWVVPAYQGLFAQIPIQDPQIEGLMRMSVVGMIVGLPLAGMVYPLIVLLVMLLPSTGSAFRGSRRGKRMSSEE